RALEIKVATEDFARFWDFYHKSDTYTPKLKPLNIKSMVTMETHLLLPSLLLILFPEPLAYEFQIFFDQVYERSKHAGSETIKELERSFMGLQPKSLFVDKIALLKILSINFLRPLALKQSVKKQVTGVWECVTSPSRSLC
ncbi:MAG: hypothetical protein JRE40_15765, partial [Deltaproteobacteria bacterium]|nr:hypothetical protein [Deltaproteobacteria bacterium]